MTLASNHYFVAEQNFVHLKSSADGISRAALDAPAFLTPEVNLTTTSVTMVEAS